MDPRRNPYAPGAGTQPPELAGRNEIIEKAAVALDRIRNGRPDRSLILYGLRGVGKTVLLNRIRLNAEAEGLVSVPIEAPEGRSLPAILIPAMRSALIRMSLAASVRSAFDSSLRALAGFAKALKVKYADIEVALDMEPARGIADSGDLEFDLAQLLKTVGQAAKSQKLAVVLYVDELQYVQEDQLASLITALHSANQEQLPVTMVAAGLPQLLGQTGRAKSYAERLFQFVHIGPLDNKAATAALCLPAKNEDAEFEPSAVTEIFSQTKGYPYFLQEWGKHSWNAATGSLIRKIDAERATVVALAELDASFFRVRFDRLTPSEKRYMLAMAELGEGPHRSGDIAERLHVKVTTVAPVRASLILKGMVFSPSHGDTAFTVPLFDAFMLRTIIFQPRPF